VIRVQRERYPALSLLLAAEWFSSESTSSGKRNLVHRLRLVGQGVRCGRSEQLHILRRQWTTSTKKQLSLMNIFTGFRNEFCVLCRQRARDLQPPPTAMRDSVKSRDWWCSPSDKYHKVSEELSRVYKRNMSRYLSLAVASTSNFNGQITHRQPCVNDDWPCHWERAIFDPPHRIHTP